jgi:hypothetical protein
LAEVARTGSFTAKFGRAARERETHAHTRERENPRARERARARERDRERDARKLPVVGSWLVIIEFDSP